MYFEIYKDGEKIWEIFVGKLVGINVVSMLISLLLFKFVFICNWFVFFGFIFGFNLEVGEYEVKLIKGCDIYSSIFIFVNDF